VVVEMDKVELINVVERLKIGLISKATGGTIEEVEYIQDRETLLKNGLIKDYIPRFIKTCRNTNEFWYYIQPKYPTYAQRREFLTEEFNKVIYYLESLLDENSPIVNAESYDLTEVIGKGGFGVVYKYHHKLLDYDFAIKVFDPIFTSNEENEQAKKRFYQEAKMLFELEHENIVKIYDIGKLDGKPFIRMQLVEDGINMNEFVEKYSTVNFERSKKPITALLKGLQYAHDKGIIHRDLKPSNFMVDKHSRFKIIDFGISTFLESDGHTKLTKTGERVAGGLYIDPCLVENPKLRDVRSDIYSVGAIWYYLLTGKAPTGSDMRKRLVESSNISTLQANI
jgi:serine/threonine-protein kinase